MKIFKSNSWILLIVFLASCGLGKQINEMSNFAKCEFRIKDVKDTKVAKVDVQNKKSYSDLSILDAALLTTSLAQGTLPLEMTLNVDVKNPNTSQASMNKMEWILLIDNIEMVRGDLNQRIAIAPNGGIATLPLHISTDLKSVLQKSTNEILNFGFGLTGASTRVTLKIKPTIMIGSMPITYPGYISVSKDFTSK